MKRDPLDDFAARLFDAIRDEAPPAGAETRAIEAARRELSSGRASAGRSAWRNAVKVLLPAAALAAGAVLLLRREEPQSSITAEAPRPSSPPRMQPSALPALEASVPLVVTPPPTPVVPPARSAPAAAPATLSNELEVLKVAENALRAGDTKGALAALDRYDTVLKGRRLRAEASVLRIETLSRAGQTQAASALARRFVADNPTSPLVDRARAFIESEKEQ